MVAGVSVQVPALSNRGVRSFAVVAVAATDGEVGGASGAQAASRLPSPRELMPAISLRLLTRCPSWSCGMKSRFGRGASY